MFSDRLELTLLKLLNFTDMFSYVVLSVLIVGAASANLTGEKARDFSGYNPSGAPYEGYDNSGSFSSGEKWPQPSFSLPSLGNCGGGSLLKPLLAGLVGAALLKLPILIAAKLLLLKLALPLGLLTAAAPLALPLGYMFFSKNKETATPAPPPAAMAEARALQQFLDSSSCLERIACSLGQTQARSSTVKTFSWMLKSLESFLGKHSEARAKVGSYREAYLTGATSDSETCGNYKCSLPEIFVRQGESSYKLL